MNPMVFTILSWEKELENRRQTPPRPYPVLDEATPAPQASHQKQRPAIIDWLHLPWRVKPRNTTC